MGGNESDDGRGALCPLCEVLEMDPESAHETVWAQGWCLPPRRARIAALMMAGMTDRRIASELELSVTSVRTYAREVLRAADCTNRTQLVLAAVKLVVDACGCSCDRHRDN